MVNHSLCEGIPVLQPPRFSPCPSGRDNFKDVRGFDIWKFCLVLSLRNLWLISVKKLATFGYVVGVFLPRKFMVFFLRILNWPANESKTFSFSDQPL